MNHLIDMTGQTFGRWTVLERRPPMRWLCRCSCGTEREVSGQTLRSGQTKSCGCQTRPGRTAAKSSSACSPHCDNEFNCPPAVYQTMRTTGVGYLRDVKRLGPDRVQYVGNPVALGAVQSLSAWSLDGKRATFEEIEAAAAKVTPMAEARAFVRRNEVL